MTRAKCGNDSIHGAHTMTRGWCAGNRNIIHLETALERIVSAVDGTWPDGDGADPYEGRWPDATAVSRVRDVLDDIDMLDDEVTL